MNSLLELRSLLTFQDLIKSFLISTLRNRVQKIGDASAGTFDCIFESSTSFAYWLRSETGAFWLRGRPGSGKSTLMK
jgi:hypothetical protein